MNLGIRAILYSARKWKKTLLVFFLLLAITTLVLSGLAIADAQEEQSEELRGVTGAGRKPTASFSISVRYIKSLVFLNSYRLHLLNSSATRYSWASSS